MIPRKRANTQNAGAKAEAKLNTQPRKPQMNRGYFLPNLSDMLLTKTLPIKNPTKITEVDMNPNEPRLQTRSNYGIRTYNITVFLLMIGTENITYLFSLAIFLLHFRPCDDPLEKFPLSISQIVVCI